MAPTAPVYLNFGLTKRLQHEPGPLFCPQLHRMHASRIVCQRLRGLAATAALFLFVLHPGPGAARPSAAHAGQNRVPDLLFEASELLESVPPLRLAGSPAGHRVDLSEAMPPIADQGPGPMSAAWAVAYYAGSYLVHQGAAPYEHGDRCQSGGQDVLSPEFIFRGLEGRAQPALGLVAAARVAVREGLPACAQLPVGSEQVAAVALESRRRFRKLRRIAPHDLDTMRLLLARGQPLLAGVAVYSNFLDPGFEGIYDRLEGSFLGGQAVTVVGFDDSFAYPGGQGAFLVLNSWSADWGDDGRAWISYRTFQQAARPVLVFEAEPGIDIVEAEHLRARLEEAELPVLAASRGAFADRVSLEWTAVPQAAGYIVERCEPDREAYETIAFTRESRFVDSLTQAGFAYRYRVRAVRESSRSMTAWAYAEGFAGAPSGTLSQSPTGLRAELQRGGVLLRWQDLPGARAYEAQRFDQDQNVWVSVGRTRASEIRDGAIGPDRRYSYRVRAFRDAPGPWSDAIELSIAGQRTPPSPVSNLRLENGAVTWTPVPGADRYTLHVFDLAQRRWLPSWPVTDSTLALPAARGAAFLVAHNRAGASEPAGPLFFSAEERSLPAPTGLQTVVDGSRVSLSWRLSAPVDHLTIFRRSATDREYAVLDTVPGDQLQFVDQLTTPGFYLYRLAGIREGRESGAAGPAIVLRQPVREAVGRRFLFRDELEAFSGVWTALDWDGESGVQELRVEIEALGENAFHGRFRAGNRAPRDFQGMHVPGSRILEGSGFRMELLTPGQESLVEITRGELSPGGLERAFVKD